VSQGGGASRLVDMNIFVAGATGALGKQLVPRLVAAGHEVTGMTRGRPDAIRQLGARPVVADALNPDAVGRAVGEARPDAIVHQLTALSGALDPRHFERALAQTNRLRTEGTDNLLAAARAAGVERFVAQSYAGWPYARSGGPVKTEEDPLDPAPAASMRTTLDAIRHLEDAVTAAGGVVLRYGGFYGPGTSFAPGGEHVEQVRKRRLPIVGDGAGVWSFVHIEDAADATVAAVERGAPGIYNITDDEPAQMREWVPVLAEAAGAKRPLRVPVWLAKLVAGKQIGEFATELRGASNEKAKRELRWRPEHPSWRNGFRESLR
jgi:nucleoside-diphosphate-sugar epimerase